MNRIGLALTLLVAGLFAPVVVAQVTPPPVSTCAGVAPPDLNTGSTPMVPGRWWNPNRYGTGWDFHYTTLNGERYMTAVWYTYDSTTKPIWLMSDTIPVVGNTWTSPLKKFRWTDSAGVSSQQVGSIAISFIPNDPTRAAIRWEWEGVGAWSFDECLVDVALPGPLASGARNVNSAYSGAWFEPVQSGWGDFVAVVQTTETNPSKYFEGHALTVYDVNGEPTWVQGTDTDSTNSPPPHNQYKQFQLYYARSNLSGYPGGYPIQDCSANTCIHVTPNVGSLNRMFTDVNAMSAYVSIDTSNKPIGGQTNVYWQRASGGQPAQLVKLTDVNQIMVDRSVCRAQTPLGQCNITVNWSAEDIFARAYRYNYATNTATQVGILDASGEFTDVLRVGDRFRYELRNGSGVVLWTTQDVRALGPDAATPPAPHNEPVPGDDSFSDQVGAPSGQVSVGSDGAATYAMPLFLPEGTAGHKPSIALSYHSGAGQGLAGRGWSISGMSAVSRCRKSLESGDGEGPHAPIQFNASDALCLGGTRLLAVAGRTEAEVPGIGSCGSGNSEYRLENDLRTRICAIGGSADDPGYFTVEQASGAKSFFGNTADSKQQVVVLGVTRTLTWAINQSNDSSNNPIIYQYHTSGQAGLEAGEQVIKRIAYGFGTNATTGAAGAEVRFYYGAAPDHAKRTSYIAGAALNSTRELKSISVFATRSSGNSFYEVRRYRPNYGTATAGNGSGLRLLTSLSEGVPGTEAVVSNLNTEPVTTAIWQSPNLTFGYSPATTAYGASAGNWSTSISADFKYDNQRLADINGDGRQDLLVAVAMPPESIPDPPTGCKYTAETHVLTYALGTASGFTYPFQLAPALHAGELPATIDQAQLSRMWFTYDFTGDGYDDLLLARPQLSSTGCPDSQTAEWQIFPAEDAGGVWQFAADENGHGISAMQDGGALTTLLGTDAKFADVSGDGLPDLVYHDATTGGFAVRRLVKSVTRVGHESYRFEITEAPVVATDRFSSVALGGASLNQADVVDFNADGLADFYFEVEPTSAATEQPKPIAATTVTNRAIEDLLRGTAAPIRNGVIYLSGGMSKSGEWVINKYIDLGVIGYFTSGGVVPGIQSASFSDLNGDGLTDVAFQKLAATSPTPTATWSFRFNQGGASSTPLTAEQTIRQLIPLGDPLRLESFQVADVDGDGVLDLVQKTCLQVVSTFCRSYKLEYRKGQRSLAASFTTIFGMGIPTFTESTPTNLYPEDFFGDFDGDGDNDFVHSSKTQTSSNPPQWTTSYTFYPNREARSELLTSVTDRLALQTDIEYAPATQPAVYTRGTGGPALDLGRGSNVFDYFGAMNLVKRIKSSLPTESDAGLKRSTRYVYEFGRMQVGGRGFLGFEQIHRIDETGADHRVVSDVYRQDYPYVGALIESRIGMLLNLPQDSCTSTVTSGCIGGPPTSNTSASAGWGVVPMEFKTQAYATRSNDDPLASPARPYQSYVSTTSSTHFSLTLASTISRYESGSVSSINAYGFPLSSTTRVSSDVVGTQDLVSTTTTTEYGADEKTARWRIGRPTYTTTSVTRDGVSSSLEVRNVYHATSGWLSETIRQPQTLNISSRRDAEYLRTAYLRHASTGVVTREVHCSWQVATMENCRDLAGFTFNSNDSTVFRFNETGWDERFRNVMSKTVPYRTSSSWARVAVETIGTRNAMGLPLSTTDGLTGVTTTYAYTRFGRPRFVKKSTGEFSVTKYRLCGMDGTNCPSGTSAAYRVETHSRPSSGASAQSPTSYVYFDRLGREVLSLSDHFRPDTSTILAYRAVSTRYDDSGRVRRKTQPYMANGPWASDPGSPLAGNLPSLPATVTTYDAADRVSSLAQPDGGIIDLDYDVDGVVRRNRTTDTLYKTTTVQLLPSGEVASTTDHDGFMVSFRYHPTGKIREVTRDGRTTTAQFNDLGWRSSLNDPDKGMWTYAYLATGEVRTQTDAKSQMTTWAYDAQGRAWTRVEGSASTSWAYDTANRNTTCCAYGQLAEVTDSAGYRRVHRYDAYGRSNDIYTRVDNVWYAERSTYDAYGRPFQRFDARNQGWASNITSFPAADLPWGTQYDYAPEGQMLRMREAYPANSGEIYYEVLTQNARGQTTVERRGDRNDLATARTFDAMGRISTILSGSANQLQNWSYSWATNGNLVSRFDALNGTADTREWFEYDNLHRLSTVRRGQQQATATQVEGYTYDSNGNLRTKSGQTLNYGQMGTCALTPGPHALSGGFGSAFCYDANGNQITERGTNTRDITYSVFDLPTMITRTGADTNNQTTSTQFVYSPERGRIKRVETIAGATTTTITVGGNEFVVRPGMAGGALEVKRYLGGDAIDTRTFSSRTVQTAREVTWLLKDHLGSTDAVVSINTSSQIVSKQRMRFDAFGGRRTSATQALTPWAQTNFDTKNTTRGYTGHEQADGAGLIHMNGRMYDARLGRFVQADPIVQDLYDTQSYNRYSYVMNRPLSLTDPTGLVADDGQYYRSPNTGSDYSGGSFSVDGMLSGSIAQGHMGMAMNNANRFLVRVQVNLKSRGNATQVTGQQITNMATAMLGGGESQSGAFIRNAKMLSAVSIAQSRTDSSASRSEGGATTCAYGECPGEQLIAGPLEYLTPTRIYFQAGPGVAHVERTSWIADWSGASAGARAAQYWADLHVQTGNPMYAVPGVFASLWTPDTALETAITLGTAGSGSAGYRFGREVTFGRNVRIAPFGNRTGNRFGEFPHYHRRGVDPISGQTLPGQGVGRHRPWETKSTDNSWWDRF
jgi:RHS repeat-associated protein